MTDTGIAAPVVRTQHGECKGVARDGVLTFKGLPYARAPKGRLRWAAPQPPEPWSEVRSAHQAGPMAPQNPTQLEAIMGAGRGEQDEDCLSLNVWTPGLSGKRPVMVWIHGGAFVHGSGGIGLYSGRNLALAGDVVVVTINYRLGAFGFLALNAVTGGRIPAGGSEGLLDQIAALCWVQDNIAAFGGDPANVTVFGESAGGMSVAALLTMPAAEGLFAKAIPQSGAGHVTRTPDRAARVAEALLEHLQIAPADAERLYELPAGRILAAQAAILEEVNGRDPRRLGAMPFQPCIDGAHLPQRPIDALRAGARPHVPVLTGTTKEEWKLFSAMDSRVNAMDEAAFAAWAEKRLPAESRAAVLAAYADGSPFERFNAIQTDRVFRLPANRLAETRTAPVFMYRFDATSPILGGVFGAAHAIELGFVFGTHSLPGADRFFGSGPEAEALAKTVIACWTAFARSGDPATAETGPWPVYEKAHRAVMAFAPGRPQLLHAPDEARRRAWDGTPDDHLGS